jgi:transcriptional regulator with XRE-family HTH domain
MALRGLRQKAGLSGGEVVARLGVLGVTLDRRTLYSYEGGRVMSPDAGVVWGLAQIYGAELEQLSRSLVASRNSQPVATLASKTPDVSIHNARLIQLIERLPREAKKELEEFVRFRLNQLRDLRPVR